MLDDSPPFYNGIKSRAFAISPPLVEDEQLFQSIVLAVAGHRKHLLVRTAEENVHSVLKLTVNVSVNDFVCFCSFLPIGGENANWGTRIALFHFWF